MSLNNPTIQPNARAPRLRVMFGQVEIPGAKTASVTTNNWYQADTFDLSFALYADRAFGPLWWSQQDDMLVDIQIGYDAGGSVAWKSILVGAVESTELHPHTGEVIVRGKDLSVRFIQAKTQETFQNQTSSEIAKTLAGRHGMTADVTDTTTLVARYWQQDHVNTTSGAAGGAIPQAAPSLGPRTPAGVVAYEKQYGAAALSTALAGTYQNNNRTISSHGQFSRITTEWDLLTTLARHEGFDLYVTGTVLHFNPATAPDATPWVVNWTQPQIDRAVSFGRASNVNDLNLQRSLTLARDIEVQVRSWHSGKGTGFTKTAKAIGTKRAQAASGKSGFGNHVQRYVYVIPNLTEDQALKRAQSILADLSKFERVISWAEPGELTLTPRNMVRLQGTGTDFDQAYFIDSIERRIAFGEGFTMHVRAKNRDSRSQAQVG
jgi:phage protein D